MFEHHHVCINGLRTHFVTAGSGEPIVFLHGFPEYWGVWKGQMEALASTHQVIAPDLRGASQTQRPLRVAAYGIEHLVADVRELLDHFEIPRATLVTQDWGALLGWSFMLRHPERVRRFVAVDMTHPALFNRELRHNPAQQEASQYMLTFRAEGEEMILADDAAFVEQALFADIQAHGGRLSIEDEHEWRALTRDRDHLTAGLGWYRAARIGPPDGQGGEGGSNLVDGLTDEQLRVKAPVLVLWSMGDPYLLPSGLEGLGDYVEDLTVERVEGATHWLTLQKPAWVTEKIRAFLGR